MAGRCGCAGAGCGCCFSSGAGEVVLGGNGSTGNCITGSLRYSTDAGNGAHAGTDGGLMVTAGPGGGGGDVAADERMGAFADDAPASQAMTIGLTYEFSPAGSNPIPDNTLTITNPSIATHAVVLMMVSQTARITVSPGGGGDGYGTIDNALTVDVTGTDVAFVPPSGLDTVSAVGYSPLVGGPAADATARLVLPISFTIPPGGAAVVAVSSSVRASLVSGTGTAVVAEREYAYSITVAP